VKVAILLCLVYSHFYLFLHLKKRLDSQKFYDDEELMNEVTMWLHTRVAEFCGIGIQKLVLG
jgi:hypothetical protein